jgi:hypothetical protein
VSLSLSLFLVSVSLHDIWKLHKSQLSIKIIGHPSTSKEIKKFLTNYSPVRTPRANSNRRDPLARSPSVPGASPDFYKYSSDAQPFGIACPALYTQPHHQAKLEEPFGEQQASTSIRVPIASRQHTHTLRVFSLVPLERHDRRCQLLLLIRLPCRPSRPATAGRSASPAPAGSSPPGSSSASWRRGTLCGAR